MLVRGAWYWYKVATLLKSAGYEVTALDMAASAVHPKGEEKARSMVFILYAFLMSSEITGLLFLALVCAISDLICRNIGSTYDGSFFFTSQQIRF